ncbi:MAG: single-stranded DNA-binding protein [Chloroflexi bacterium]|nr:single-stranded DNA-binding protein [Chloroflexota bacterium]MBV9132500.1 single-stranded DNA-binding protein [Chloroflexota bacterium]MBV9897696.1 single-stranded DNA-binding protein [Chloroflexota bacterium]
MAGLCKVIVIGNLGRDPEKRYTQDGRPVTRFSVAATTRRRERDGEWADHTEWFSVTVFGRQAETLAERVTKGTRIYVEGRLESRQYETQTGQKGFSLDVVANEVIPLDTRQRDGDFSSAGEFEAAAPAPTFASRGAPKEEAADLEDLPF